MYQHRFEVIFSSRLCTKCGMPEDRAGKTCFLPDSFHADPDVDHYDDEGGYTDTGDDQVFVEA